MKQLKNTNYFNELFLLNYFIVILLLYFLFILLIIFPFIVHYVMNKLIHNVFIFNGKLRDVN